MCRYRPMDRALEILDDKNYQGANTIFVRDMDYVTRRIQSADAISINGLHY